MFTRDSILWWLLIAGSILAYLANAPSPDTWGWPEWIQFLSAAVGILAAKLATSPLSGAPKGNQVKPSRFIGLLLVLLVVPGLVIGCGPKTKPNLIKADFALYQAVQAISDTEIVLSRAGALTKEQSITINEALLPAAKLGLEATQALRAWQPGQPLPDQIPQLVRELGDISRLIINIVASPEARAPLLEKVALAQQAVLVLVALGVGR